MRNLLWASVFGVSFLLGCGQSSVGTQTGSLPFQVLSRSTDATVEAAKVSGSRVLVKMNAAALSDEQNYRFTFRLEPGGTVELRARAKADLSRGVVLKFTRTDTGVTFTVNGDDLSADVAKVLGDGSGEISANFDIHRHSDHSHGMYEVNGKKGATGDFEVVQLQGNWGFVVEKASVRDFAVGPAKHGH